MKRSNHNTWRSESVQSKQRENLIDGLSNRMNTPTDWIQNMENQAGGFSLQRGKTWKLGENLKQGLNPEIQEFV